VSGSGGCEGGGHVTVPRFGRTSFTTVYEAVQVDCPEPVVVARGEGIVVLVDAEGRPTPVPDALREAMLVLAGVGEEFR
jgi:acyl-CoA thioesterase FadM